MPKSRANLIIKIALAHAQYFDLKIYIGKLFKIRYIELKMNIKSINLSIIINKSI